MPSEKLTRILLADSPFTKDQIAVMDEVAGWDWVYAQAAKKAQTKRPKVCLTGFSAVDKARLVALAGRAGLDVAASVSASLTTFAQERMQGRRS